MTDEFSDTVILENKIRELIFANETEILCDLDRDNPEDVDRFVFEWLEYLNHYNYDFIMVDRGSYVSVVSDSIRVYSVYEMSCKKTGRICFFKQETNEYDGCENWYSTDNKDVTFVRPVEQLIKVYVSV